ncbi:MAG: hypothetical protein U9R21_02250 [Candidatus Thermoplasmatota archaeon]|nr:hypothetical protein [Candidatus Thermoplasmatota archaeon]
MVETIKDVDTDFWFFANASSATYREDEFYLRFARHDPKGEIESLSVHMSPKQAKMVLEQLKHLINNYEEIFEKIPEVRITTEDDVETDFQPSVYG